MRAISAERRKLAVQAGAMAAMSGTGPLLLRDHPRAGWVWMTVVMAMAVRVVVLMVRLRRSEGCA